MSKKGRNKFVLREETLERFWIVGAKARAPHYCNVSEHKEVRHVKYESDKYLDEF